MSKNLSVSIVIPSFNKGQFIEETINSVKRQTYNNIELIIVDAESNDGTYAILKRYRKDIYRCIVEPDKGQSDAINKGIKIARGEIVGWLNADDLLYPDGIEAIVNGFDSHPRVGLVYGSGAKIDALGKTIKNIPYRPFNPRLLKQLYYILQPSMYFRKDLFVKVGGLNVESHFAMDWELVLKLLNVTDFLSIPQKIAKLRMYEETKTAAGGWECYREIARIGMKQNGITDVNYLAFVLRSLVRKLKLPVDDKRLRAYVDKLCNVIAGGDLYMVYHWPEFFNGRNR